MATCGRARTLLSHRGFSSMAPRPLQTIELRGMERYFGSIDSNSATVAVTMHVDGPVQPLLDKVHQAFANTMNKHPRMRVKQCPSDSTRAFVYPRVSADTIKNEEYVKVVHVDDEHHWQQIVQEESEKPFDRANRFPFYLNVLVDPKKDNFFSLSLFCDHYQADGGAVSAVLHSILEDASKPELSEHVEERALPESLFHVWSRQSKWKALLAQTFTKLFTPTMIELIIRSYTPSLPAAPTQNDFDLFKPLTPNKTYGMWQSGSRENMLRSLARCREEKVTMQGAFIASIIAVFAEATKRHEQNENPIKMILKYAVDARSRVSDALLQPDDVGCFAGGGDLLFLNKEGVQLSARFWDVARRSKQELESNLESVQSFIGGFFMDEYARLCSPENKTANKSLVFPKSLNADVLLSNMGRYSYPVKHEVMGDGETLGLWHIKNYFIYCSAPATSPCLTFWMTSVGNGVDYSLMHKLEDTTAQRVFANAVKVFERIGEIGEHETVEQVVRRLLLEAEA